MADFKPMGDEEVEEFLAGYTDKVALMPAHPIEARLYRALRTIQEERRLAGAALAFFATEAGQEVRGTIWSQREKAYRTYRERTK